MIKEVLGQGENSVFLFFWKAAGDLDVWNWRGFRAAGRCGSIYLNRA